MHSSDQHDNPNDQSPVADMSRVAPLSARLRGGVRAVELLSLALAIPAWFYPYLVLYLLLLVGTLVALVAFMVLVQWPMSVAAGVFHRALHLLHAPSPPAVLRPSGDARD